jgi:hypothetical protein
MDMKHTNGINYWELYGNILKKREKKRVEGWELATHNSNNTTPLDAKIKKIVGALKFESSHQPSKQIV